MLIRVTVNHMSESGNTSPGALLAEYVALESQESQLSLQVEGASPLTRDLFEQALANTTSRISEITSDPRFAEEVEAIVQPFAQANEELLTLEGLLSPEIIAVRRQSIQEQIDSDPIVSAALRLRTKYVGKNALAEEVDVEYISTPDQTESVVSQEEIVKPRKKVTMTYQNGVLKVGEQGRYFKTSGASHEGQRDYTTERLRLLEVLIDKPDTWMSVKSLWEIAFPGTPTDAAVLQNARSWFTTLTYRRQPIVVHNGKRSNGSAYGIFGFDITFTRMPASVHEPTRVPLKARHTPSSRNTVESVAQHETLEPKIKFPLSAYECLLLGEFLNTNRAILTELDLEPVSEMALDSLRSSDTEADRALMIREFGTLKAARLAIFEKVRKFFSDETSVLNVISQMSARDNRYNLFSYLIDLEGEDRFSLLTKLANSERGHDIQVDCSKYGGRLVVGAIQKPEKGAPTPQTLEKSPEEPAPIEETVQIEKPVLTPQANKVKEKEAAWKSSLRQKALEIIKQLKDDQLFLPGVISARIASQKSSSNKLGTVESIERLAKAGILSTSGLNRQQVQDVELSASTMVISQLLNTNRALFGNSRRRKEAVALIEALVTEALDSNN